MPLQFLVSLICAIFYVWKELGPTARPIYRPPVAFLSSDGRRLSYSPLTSPSLFTTGAKSSTAAAIAGGGPAATTASCGSAASALTEGDGRGASTADLSHATTALPAETGAWAATVASAESREDLPKLQRLAGACPAGIDVHSGCPARPAPGPALAR